MVKHLDVVFNKCDLTALHSALSVKLHAYLTAKADIKTVAMMHRQGVHPYSLFTRKQEKNILFRLSVLSAEALPLCEIVQNTEKYLISGLKGGLIVQDVLEHNSVFVDNLLKEPPRQMKLTFASPATYKYKLVNTNLFSLAPLLYTVAEKLKLYEGIYISKSDVDKLCENVSYPNYRLHSDNYYVKRGNTIPGFSGEMVLKINGTKEELTALALLLRYSEYSGIGAKTALGMGGILLEEQSLRN